MKSEDKKEKRREYNKQYLKNNPFYHKRRYLKNKDKILAQVKDYQKKNRSTIRITTNKWRAKNRERVRKTHNLWKKNNKQKYDLNRSEYMQKDHNKIVSRIRSRLKTVLKKYKKTKKIRGSDEFGIDYVGIINQLKPFPKNLSKYHIDHIKPICSFNLTNPKEFKKAFAPENHQWLLVKDNLRKSRKF